MEKQRILSLLPSATEFLCLLGKRDSLVGVSHECDHPSDVCGITVATSSRLLGEAARTPISPANQEILRSALGIYDIKLDVLAELKPELVITQDLCDLCGYTVEELREALRELCAPEPELLCLQPRSLTGIWETIRQVGGAVGRENEAEAVVGDLVARVDRVREKIVGVEHRPTVLLVEWMDPVMIGGLWTADIIEAAGGEALVSRSGEPISTMERAQVEALDPDVVLLKPSGFTLEEVMDELPSVEWLLGKKVFAVEGNAYFNRPGPRIVESVEILASILYPDLFPERPEAQRVW